MYLSLPPEAISGAVQLIACLVTVVAALTSFMLGTRG